MKKKRKFDTEDGAGLFILFCSLLNVVESLLVALKLIKVIDWKWSVVLIPLWIDCGFAVVLVITYAFIIFHDK